MSRAYDWKLDWTFDDETWYERGFYTFEAAQSFMREMSDKNKLNPNFGYMVARMMEVNATSFLNAESAGAVELAPHLLRTSDTFA